MREEFKLNDPIFLNDYIDPFVLSLIMIFGILINCKFLKNMKEDDSNRGPNSNGLLIRDVMATNAKTQMLVWPTLWVLFWLIHIDTTFPIWMQPWFCHLKLLAYIFRIYFGFNSLAVAAMRYAFIVHNTTIVKSFGIDKTKTLFYYGSILIPFLIAIFYECTTNAPFESGRKVFEICQSTTEVSANITFGHEKKFNSPIFNLVQRNVPENVVYYFGISTKLCLGIVFGNLFEGLLYWKTFRYIARYN